MENSRVDRLGSTSHLSVSEARSPGKKPAAEMSLSVVVPVYKEEGNISEFLRRVSKILQRITQDYEIIFCLDPSPDRTEG